MEDYSRVNIGFVKLFFDKGLSFFLLMWFWPSFLFVFLCILLESLFVPSSRGSFFYSEIRYSQGIPFMFYKFRIFKQKVLEDTLRKEGFIETKPLEQDRSNMTFVGWVLKTFYLDELPQLWNILKGDMSFVGPRPYNKKEYDRDLALGHARKKIVRAGLVGPVQIYKGEWDAFGGQVSLDDAYIEKCRSYNQIRLLFYDIWIIIRSLFVVFRGKGL